MYKGFIIDDFKFNDDRDFIQNSLSEVDETTYLSNESFNLDLEKFILRDIVNRDLVLDGTKISQQCFPQVKADIFISHSHKDISQVKEFAKKLYLKTGLVSFIDSEVWNYADDLLRKIDSKYTFDDETDLYDYNSRNISTSYVHLMLNTALLNMIDNCECLFFLNTPNSFNVEKEINGTTYSPWIYSELSMANRIEKKIPKRHEELRESLQKGVEAYFSQIDSNADLKIALKLDTENLIKCNYSHIDDWLTRCNSSKKHENLDSLYNMFTAKKSNYTRLHG